jgi:dynein intermediate chain
VPIVSTIVNPSGPQGLNKLAWDRKEGRRVAIGSSDGRLYVYDVGELAVPKANEWDLFRRTFSSLAGHRDGLSSVGR